MNKFLALTRASRVLYLLSYRVPRAPALKSQIFIIIYVEVQ